MCFSLTERAALLHRLRRIRGQFEGVERAIEDESSCTRLLHLIATARSAMDGCLVSVIEHHLQSHVAEDGAERSEAIKETVKMAQLFLQ